MRHLVFAAIAAAILLPAAPARAEDEKDRRISELERLVRELREEVDHLKADKDGPSFGSEEENLGALEERLRALEEAGGSTSPRHWTNRFTIGGYGEVHLNFSEGSGSDQLDYHRFVLYIGHEFADWLLLDAELEIEHAAVGGDFGGELLFEQLSLDVLLSDAVNIRVGRFLTPVGIVNVKHEPPSFHGVERPTFARVIVPSTWSSDGLGIFGTPAPFLSYEVYVAAGLDGTGFSATSGIRGGRIKERPSLSEPAVTGRIDVFPLVTGRVEHGQHLRFGVSGWFGGLDNGNRGRDPGVDASLALFSGDFEYTIAAFEFRGAIAYGDIDGAETLPAGTASAIFGWYAEAAWHLFPEEWKTGRLAGSDLAVFVRYEEVDTQFRMPSGVAADGAGDRREVTFGITFFLRPNLVLKADYQVREDESGSDLPDLVNFGVGWQF